MILLRRNEINWTPTIELQQRQWLNRWISVRCWSRSTPDIHTTKHAIDYDVKMPAIEANCLLFPLWPFSHSFIHVKCIQFKGSISKTKTKVVWLHSFTPMSIDFAWNESETNKTKNQILWTIQSCIERCGLVCLAWIIDCDCDSFNKLVVFCVLFDHSYLLRW